jgi:uncharacterized OB-fold protein
MSYDKPLPNVTDPATAPFWKGLRDEQLLVQRCTGCHRLRYPAAPICPECLRAGGEWFEIPATGTLWSYVVYHRDLAGSFAADIPYAVGIVELIEQLHLVARIDGDLAALRIGAQANATFIADDVTLLRWVLTLEQEQGNG